MLKIFHELDFLDSSHHRIRTLAPIDQYSKQKNLLWICRAKLRARQPIPIVSLFPQSDFGLISRVEVLICWFPHDLWSNRGWPLFPCLTDSTPPGNPTFFSNEIHTKPLLGSWSYCWMLLLYRVLCTYCLREFKHIFRLRCWEDTSGFSHIGWKLHHL